MNEKIIVESKTYSLKKIFLVFLAVAFVSALVLWCILVAPEIEIHKRECLSWWSGDESWIGCYGDCSANFNFWIYVFMPSNVIILTGALFCLIMKSMKIVVTDKRVYGKTYFGRSVDLPLDSISAVGSKWMKGISVATSSGKISFLLIKNAQEIHEEIRKLLIARQEEKAAKAATAPTVVAPTSQMDELKKLKELFDGGVITQEEFDAKKKQLLGL